MQAGGPVAAPLPSGPQSWLHSLAVYFSDIKIAHSVFALPFAASVLFLVRNESGQFGYQSLRLGDVFLLLICMVTGRTFAMGINRILDWRMDQSNPRTAGRAIPSGRLSLDMSMLWTGAAGVMFVAASFAFGVVIGLLSFLVLLFFALYPLLKRWTWTVHLYLGACIGLAPLAVWLATGVTHVDAATWAERLSIFGTSGPVLWFLFLGITAWVASFDIIYATQDAEFDRRAGIASIPARFGVRRALFISRGLSVVALGSWALSAYFAGGGAIMATDIGIIGAFLCWEHWLASRAIARGASIEMSFFTMNALVSILFFVGTVADSFLRMLP